MECEFVCNFKKCRKTLKSEAWVTSCSHIFCCEDGEREFHKALICPACETELSGKLDIIKIDTNPSEQFKAIILAGLQPETIMEIASRAMSFWSYQIHHELLYRQNLATKCQEQNNQMEEMCKVAFDKSQTEINSIYLAKEVESTRTEVVNQKQRCAELSEKLMEKSRQLQKVQAMYENLRRKAISPFGHHTTRQNLHHVKAVSAPPQSFQFPLNTPELSSMSRARIARDNFNSCCNTTTAKKSAFF